MADKKQLGFRAQPQLADEVKNFAEERGISQSEALRRIVEAGLSEEQSPVADGGQPVEQVVALTVAGIGAFATIFLGIVGFIAGLFKVTGASMTAWDISGAVLGMSIPAGIVTAAIAVSAYWLADSKFAVSRIEGHETR